MELNDFDDEPAFYVSELSANTIKYTTAINGKMQFSKTRTDVCTVPVYWHMIRPVSDGKPVGFWQGKFSDDGGATLYEVPQESAFGRTYPNYPLYAEGHRNIKQLDPGQWHRHWQVSSVMDRTEAEIDFADFMLIVQEIEGVYGIGNDKK